MPSDSMNIQEQGFRSRMFGGFDKNDVLAYMNTLANEAQQHELEYEEKLRQLEAFYAALAAHYREGGCYERQVLAWLGMEDTRPCYLGEVAPGGIDGFLSHCAGKFLRQEDCEPFYREFQRELGMSPKKYLLNQRMEHARQLLVYSSDTIEAIAAETGYADRFHFSKAFKRFYDVPPAAYRENSSGGGKKKSGKRVCPLEKVIICCTLLVFEFNNNNPGGI